MKQLSKTKLLCCVLGLVCLSIGQNAFAACDTQKGTEIKICDNNTYCTCKVTATKRSYYKAAVNNLCSSDPGEVCTANQATSTTRCTAAKGLANETADPAACPQGCSGTVVKVDYKDDPTNKCCVGFKKRPCKQNSLAEALGLEDPACL